jgi:hypothetical protein
MNHLRTPARDVLAKRVLVVLVAGLWLSLAARAQTYTTSDSSLKTGSALTETSNAPGTSGAVGLVHSASSSSTNLWLIYTNPWGVTSGSGTISINYTGAGSIVTSVNLTGLPGGGVDGSPFVLLGCDQWAGCSATGQPPQFPKQLSAMSSLIVDYSYAFAGTIGGSRDIDMIWDEWVCNSSHPNGIPDCLEVEVLPYYSFSLGHGGATFVRTVNLPVTLNGTSTTFSFDEYTWGQDVLYFPHTLPGLSSASLRFDMLTLLNQAVSDYGNSSFSWLMGMEAGTEFGGNATQSYSLTFTKFDVEQTLAGGPPAPPTNLTDVVH